MSRPALFQFISPSLFVSEFPSFSIFRNPFPVFPLIQKIQLRAGIFVRKALLRIFIE